MGIRSETIAIAVDGQRIEGTVLAPQAPNGAAPGMLFVHGSPHDALQSIAHAS